MKLQAEVGAEVHEIEFTRDGNRVQATMDGRVYDLEVSEPEANIYLFKHEGRVVEAFVSPSGARPAERKVSVGAHDLEITLVDPKRLRGGAGDAGSDIGGAEIRSAMPGKIVRILVQQGDAVEKDQGVIVVEAMKMQNELRSPKAGQVKEIRVDADSTVSAGDVLITIE